MKRGAAIAFLLLSSLLCAQARGRVIVRDGTVLTDRGSPLRGIYVVLDVKEDLMPDAREIKAIKSIGLNAVHLYAENAWAQTSAGDNASKVDDIVKWTRENSLYLVLTMSGWADNEPMTHAFIEKFWNFYAPRYRDETHVIYEICNEPGNFPYGEAALKMQTDIYALIRSKAPRSHVVLMSAYKLHAPEYLAGVRAIAKAVDWKNASIGGHGYFLESAGMAEAVRTIKASGFPLLVAEFHSVENKYANSSLIRVYEAAGLSYLNFVEIHNALGRPALYKDVIEASGIRWKPDFGSWPSDLPDPRPVNPYVSRRAAFCDAASGWRSENIESSVIEYIEDGSWAAYYRLDFGSGATAFSALCSSQKNGGSIEIRLDSLDGPVVGSCPVSWTGTLSGDWTKYEPFSCALAGEVKGVHDLYLIFRKASAMPAFNLMSFEFIAP